MNAVCTIIGKEIRDGLRNRWVLATALLLAALALALGLLGSSPTGTVKAEPLTVTVVSLSSLSIFLVPLIAMLLAYDAVVGEVDRGTMALLLSYPVSRGQVLIGKFIGHLAILALATGAGYGSAGLALQWAYGGLDASAWQPFALLIGASVLLGASFLAMGYLISSLVRERATAAGIAVGVWLFFVVIYDMALLGVLAADQGRHVSPGLLNALLLLNPSDVYRLLNLTGFENISLYAGMAGVSDQASLPLAALVAALLLWIAVPFLLATAAFRNKPL
ncbi:MULTISPECIES: ABC transporter permease [Achromobacter]|jgi:Cu-processing system permease protein|uniref:ABC transporter permease n=1 Tax=Achromobacter aegrifaciens TaxID=1287736 RepID=A0ABU2D9I2_ACHAE|nr:MULTISPECIES: ABC transporter permease [Achromobacter]MDH1303638.1 ABC transporter permease [Achromobacter sp. GD03932]MDR7944718.1 ABC transporter permease [Achromobacter aegrifaciens]WLW63790.1 ABC transporter permease [Achromobacter aegrifaciens]